MEQNEIAWAMKKKEPVTPQASKGNFRGSGGDDCRVVFQQKRRKRSNQEEPEECPKDRTSNCAGWLG